MSRPRSFVWLSQFGISTPQIWFDDPRLGPADVKPIAERKLDPSEFELSLNELAARYPAPAQEAVQC